MSLAQSVRDAIVTGDNALLQQVCESEALVKLEEAQKDLETARHDVQSWQVSFPEAQPLILFSLSYFLYSLPPLLSTPPIND